MVQAYILMTGARWLQYWSELATYGRYLKLIDLFKKAELALIQRLHRLMTRINL